MGLFASAKKMPKRVKRTIRKSLSGVCLASSLIVAAVPAAPAQGYTIIPSNLVQEYDYSYGVDQEETKGDDIDLGLSISLNEYKPVNKLAEGDLYKTLYVRQDPQGNYEYGWQFQLYKQKFQGVWQGVICDYNSSYETELLEVNKYLPLEYVTVTTKEYDDFYQAFYDSKTNTPNAETITIDGYTYDSFYEIVTPANSVTSGTDEYYLKKYFEDKYTAWLSDYAIWKTKKDNYDLYKAWLDNGGEGDAPNSQSSDPGPMDPLKQYVCDMSGASNNLLKREYFCEINKKFNTSSITLNGYTLVPAYDYCTESTATGGTPQIYLAQGEANTDFDTGGTGSTTASNNDKYGFFVKERISVVAIGEQAFMDVYKVNKMVLSGDMAYIGDEAFLNSYVKSITFSNVSAIGNRAFKNCSQLAEITFGEGTTTIGTEAFYGCGLLQKLVFPYSVKKIGPGAFAFCTGLNDIDMSSIGQADSEIGAFAFYNDIALNTVSFSDKITKIGDAAFACSQGAYGSLSEFSLPINVNSIGDFLLAGRGNLIKVNMPDNFGRTSGSSAKLPEHMFWNCYNLGCVIFPDDGMGSCGYIDFEDCDEIFATVMTPDFYVQGPEKNANGSEASPRMSTWGKCSGVYNNSTGLYNQVPYVYLDSQGNRMFEISDGNYILVIDNDGMLQSCKFSPSASKDYFDMTIPEKVGNTQVNSVSTDCFSDPDIKNYMQKLYIADNTISEIADSAFKDFKALEYVSIGNSVTKIGASAFEGCNRLTHVNFETPKNGYGTFPLENIGTNAFSTGAESLIFEGDIDEAYGPFVWATDPSNYVYEDAGTRVCYKSGYPYYLTVIVDNRNGLATLVDYPHYNELNELSGTGSDVYSYIDENGEEQFVPISLIDRYENLGKEIMDVSGNIFTYTVSLKEEKLVDATLNINIPSGIESIDVNGFMNNTSPLGDGYSKTASNSSNVSKYLLIDEYYPTYKQDGLFNGYYGKYSGTDGAREYPTDSKYEEADIGNDRIESVKLSTVSYLPDLAFNSCENLQEINLGSDLSDLGSAPFTGCTKLTSIGGGSDDFFCYNGIIYSNNDDGTYNIVEVLSTRGILVGGQKIKVSEEDPYLSNVSSIGDGAFRNCDGITGVDLRGMDLLDTVPDNCFEDCDKLNQVILPENITTVGHNAFLDTSNGIELVVYGEEVYLSFDSFGAKTDMPTEYRVITYKDSAAYKTARDIGADVSEVLDETYHVQFFDYDGRELSKILYVKEGDSIKLTDIPADPVREGYVFKGWNKDLTYISEDTMIMATYEVKPNEEPPKEDPQDEPKQDEPKQDEPKQDEPKQDEPKQDEPKQDEPKKDDNNNQQGNNNNNQQGNNNQQTTPEAPKFYTLTVTNGNGSGSYAAGAVVIITCSDPPSGKEFDKWVPNSDDLGLASVNVAATTMVMPAHEASVAATFKNKPTNTNGSGTGTGSGTSTKTDDKKTDDKKTDSGNTVVISKPGISNSSLASANVTGSNDNYVIRIAETANATAAIEKALTNEYGSLDNIRYSAMDITLYDSTGSTKITNYSGLSVTITIPVPDVMTQYAGNNKVAGVVNEKLDKLNPKFTTIDGVPCISFTATHFSPYVIYVDTSNLSATGVIDATPKTADGIQPKWFLCGGLAALGIALFFMKDKRTIIA